MVNYLFFIDGEAVQSPRNWNDSSILIERSSEIKGLFATNVGDLEFIGDGYDLLYSKLNILEFGGKVAIQIVRDIGNGWEQFLNGVAFVADIDFDLWQKVAKLSILDEGWSGLVAVNKKAKVFPTSPLSKDGTTITGVTPIDVDFYNLAGAYAFLNRKVFVINDVLEYLTAWMTNGALTYVSDYFSTGEGADYGLVAGSNLRSGTFSGGQFVPEISFEGLFAQLSKKFNVSFAIEDDGAGGQRLRVEDSRYFLSANASVTLDYVPNIRAKVLAENLYSTVRNGDEKAWGATYYTPFNLLSHRLENVNNVAAGNVDKELDLVTNDNYCVDANAIMDVLVNSNLEYDTVVFIVQCDFGAGQAIKGSVGTLYPNLYNAGLFNGECLRRWVNTLPISLSLREGSGNDGFQAGITTAQTQDITATAAPNLLNVFIGTDDTTFPNYDATGNYDVVTGRYTAPATGMYSFRFWPRLITGVSGILMTYYPMLEVYDNLSVLQQQLTINDEDGLPITFTLSGGVVQTPFGNCGDFTFDGCGGALFDNVILNSTWYVVFRLYMMTKIQNGTYSYLLGSIIRSEYTQNGGGIVVEPNFDEALTLNYNFDYPMTWRQVQSIRAGLGNQILFSDTNNGHTAGYVKRINYKVKSGMSEFELIGNFEGNG
jgi:hypothetical protein